MATPRFDAIAIEFLRRIPDQFKTTFTPGSGAMPDGYVLDKEVIADYVNRAMLKLFNTYWEALDLKRFSNLFPELIKFSNIVNFTSGVYTIASPYLDFKELVGAIESGDSNFIKIYPASKLTVVLSEEYPQYTGTNDTPIIIHVGAKIYLFPTETNAVNFQYIGLPLNPTTGLQLTQNGSYDSPFLDDWNSRIADLAEELYLIDSFQTT